MTERDDRLQVFLARAGWGEATRTALAGDASNRCYERLARNGGTAVLMDAPPPAEDVRPFMAVAALLAGIGLSPPDVIAADEAHGFLLLQDLGDDLVARAIERGTDPVAPYAAAIDVLVALQLHEPPAWLPAFDEQALVDGLSVFPDWHATSIDDAAHERYRTIWRGLLPLARVGPPVIVYRDYHAENLVWRPRRTGLARLGLLDFQDALRGPCAYDVVSLLEDARRDVAPALATSMIERYLTACPQLDRDAFHAAYAILGAQRNSRLLGLFSRLAQQAGKTQYLALKPRVAGYLARDLAHPVLAELRAWHEAHP